MRRLFQRSGALVLVSYLIVAALQAWPLPLHLGTHLTGKTDFQAIADELDPRYRAIPFVAVGCGLRPEEVFGLHRADVDRDAAAPQGPVGSQSAQFHGLR